MKTSPVSLFLARLAARPSAAAGGDERRSKAPALSPPVPWLVDLHRLRESGQEQDGLMRLHRNERLQPLPAWFLERIRESIQSDLLTNYPTTDTLYRQLSDSLGIPEDRLLLTSGSDAAVKALYHAYVRPGETVVMLDPSYAMYEVYAQMFQARSRKISFNEALQPDVGRLLGSVVPGVRVVMLANPNQPTATLLDEPVLRQLVERTKAVGAVLAVDEAYYPFSHTTVLPWSESAPHLLVMRTFSKAAGLAGLRIGFVAGCAELVANLSKVRSVHDVNSMAMLCAAQILAHPQVIDDYVACVEAGKRLLADRARALGLEPLPTATNFLLIRVAPRCQPVQLIKRLREQGYLVKGPFSTPGLVDCIRVTLGPPDMMAAFADALKRTLHAVT